MTRIQTLALTLGALVALAACAQEEEVVYIEPQPIVSEPAYTKY